MVETWDHDNFCICPKKNIYIVLLAQHKLKIGRVGLVSFIYDKDPYQGETYYQFNCLHNKFPCTQFGGWLLFT
jgi:hypothetical protein